MAAKLREKMLASGQTSFYLGLNLPNPNKQGKRCRVYFDT